VGYAGLRHGELTALHREDIAQATLAQSRRTTLTQRSVSRRGAAILGNRAAKSSIALENSPR
jgi:hypothetical protein